MEGRGREGSVVIMAEQGPRKNHKCDARHGKGPHANIFLLLGGADIGIQCSPEGDIKAFACLGQSLESFDVKGLR